MKEIISQANELVFTLSFFIEQNLNQIYRNADSQNDCSGLKKKGNIIFPLAAQEKTGQAVE